MRVFLCRTSIFVAVLVAAGGPALGQTAPLPAPSPAPSPVTAKQLYDRSVAEMRAIEIPPFVTFASAWNSTGLRFDIYQDDAKIGLALGDGRNFSDHHAYTVAYRQTDRMLAASEGSRDRLIGHGSHFLDPTWVGAYDLLRYGVHGGPVPGGPAPGAASPTPAPAATATDPAMRTIGMVSAISAAFYRVEDQGTGSCPSGAAGHMLKLAALRDPHSHPLTAVTIDIANNRFCSMRFNLNESGAVGVTGNYELHFEQSADYWLVSGGAIDIAVRILGIAARHVLLRWENSAFATPADIAATEFQKLPSATK